MDSLVDRAVRVTAHHPSPALRLGELAHLVQRTGAAVPQGILLRALAAAPAEFRLLDPWRGAWRGLTADRRGRRASGMEETSAATLGIPDGLWIVPRPGRPRWTTSPPEAQLARLRACLIRLGWSVDADSAIDLARWYTLVLEGSRGREALARAA